MKKLFFLLLIFSFSIGLSAQNVLVKGVVISKDDNETIPGVTILEKGTSNGTTTDINGNYEIEVAEDAILQFSFIGLKTQEVIVAGRVRIDVAMETESVGLNEVVVIGYGTLKKRNVTGSVSVLGSKSIEEIKPLKVEQALQGTVSGVNVTQQSGAPGAGLDIRIRGISTNGDASPVAIIDGYEGDLSLLNPDDIETITVLKDAQAAIYGTVGANGIILITTKKGERNAPTSVSVNSSFGFQETTRKLPVLDATEYAVLLNESYASNGEELPYPDISGLGSGTDWQDELFSREPVYDNNFRVSGGSNRLGYSFSGSDLRQKGIIGGDKAKFSRTTGRLNLNGDMTKWLSFNTSLIYTYVNRTAFNDFGLGSVLFNAVNIPSTIPVYDESGNYYLAPTNLGIEIINPLQQLANTYNDYYLRKWNGNFGLDAKISKHITATARFGFNTTDADYKTFSMIVDYGGKVFDVSRSSVYQSKDNYNDFTFDAFASYDNTFKSIHNLIVTLGTTIYKTWGNGLSATGYDIPNNSWENADISLANGLSDTKTTGSYTYDQRRLSYFGRLQYNIKDRYLFSAMLRNDASTKFGPENRVAWFPSATMGWIISEESFMKKYSKIDLVKFRASYGWLGSDKIPNYGYISQLSGEAAYVFDGQIMYGRTIGGALLNPNIKWEQSQQFDVGFDLAFYNSRLDLTMDYFNKTTKDLLIADIPVSGILGTSAPGAYGPIVNAGTVRNQGFEFAVGYKGGEPDKFSYSVNYNFTYLHNEVLEVNNGTGYMEGGSFGVGQPYPARMEEGYPIGYFYGYVTDGVFQSQEEVDMHPSQVALGADASPGDLRYRDINGDGVIDTDDRTYIGDPIPDYIMGLNLSLNYKNIDFMLYAYASIGNDIVRNYERTQPNVNRMEYWLDRWTGYGTSDEVPRVTTAATSNNVFSDFYVEDGSYMRLQRIALGYTIPEKYTKKVLINKLRLYLAVSNLFTITKYQGFDPAASSGVPIGSGFDSGFYPAARTYWIGLNLNI